jgi:hypothetical protein
MLHAHTSAPVFAAPPWIRNPRGAFTIREYRAQDQIEVDSLRQPGLMKGQVDPSNSATDRDYVTEVHLSRPPNRFWVAECGGRIIGTLGLVQEEKGVGHLRRLRVDPKWQHDDHVAGRLIQVAAAYAREKGFLKLVLHTPVDDRRMIPLLGRWGLLLARKRVVHDRPIIEFYVNLYAPPKGVDEMMDDEWPSV